MSIDANTAAEGAYQRDMDRQEDVYSDDPMASVAATPPTTTLAEWIAEQQIRSAEQQRRRAVEHAEREQDKRDMALLACNGLLQRMGVPFTVLPGAADFPYVSIAGQTFLFSEGGYHQDYGHTGPHLRHAVRIAEPTEEDDGWHLDRYQIEDAGELVLWLTGQREHFFPPKRRDEEHDPSAKPAVPELYRVMFERASYRVAEWLNEQAAEGYDLHTLSADAHPEDTGAWVVVRKTGGPA